jgi:hypothetical protein
MFEAFVDVVPSFFGWLNLHTVIILPMFWIYKQEKARLESEK